MSILMQTKFIDFCVVIATMQQFILLFLTNNFFLRFFRGFDVVNTESVPGLQDLEVVRNLQMFTQVWRAKMPMNQPNINFSKHFQRLLQAIFFKLRAMTPCAICDLRFKLDLPENDEIQLLVTEVEATKPKQNGNTI